MKDYFNLIIFTCLVMVAPFSDAALVSLDDPQYGAGSITLDTNTNLEWLDISITRNRSYNEISSELNFNGEYFGFRYATKQDVQFLFENAGIPIVNTGFSPDQGYSQINTIPIENLATLLGGLTSSHPLYDSTFLQGLTSSPGISPQTNHRFTAPFLEICVYPDPSCINYVNDNETTSRTAFRAYMTPTTSVPTLGSWLIRESQIAYVPLPPSILLFLSGIVSIGLFGNARKPKSLA